MSPSVKATGPTALDANVTRLMAVSNPDLEHINLSCPQTSTYPKVCQLTATETGRGKLKPVTGKVSVLGIDTRTHTYAYQVIYAPARG